MDLESDSISLDRGETIYQAGDGARTVFLVRSGLVSLHLPCGDKLIEIGRVSSPQLLGVEALHGLKTWNMTAIAANDVELFPFDIGTAHDLTTQGTPLINLFFAAILAKCASLANEETTRLFRQQDPTPCPESDVTRVFAVLYHAALHTGTTGNGETSVVWEVFRKYCQRNFLESPIRLEYVVRVLERLNMAKVEMIACESDSEAPDEIGTVRFNSIERVREFYELNHRIESGDEKATHTPDYEQIIEMIARCNTPGTRPKAA